MKNKEIQDLINFIKKSDLDDVSIETENYKIRVKKNQNKNTTQPKKVVEEIIETTSEIHNDCFYLLVEMMIIEMIF